MTESRNPVKLRSLLVGTAVAALTIGLAGCGSDDTKAADGSLTLTIAEFGEGTESLVAAAGVFDDADYDVEFAHFDTGPAMLAAISSNKLDLAYVGGLPPVVAAASGMKFKVVAAVAPRDPSLGGDNVLVAPGSDITSEADLAGATIGLPKGTSSHALAMKVLEANGLGVEDVELAFLEPAQLAPALSSGKIDAAAAYEPFASAVRLTGAEVLVAGGEDYPTSSWMTTSDANLADPDTKAAVTDAIERIAEAYEWAVEHPAEHAEAIAEDSGMSLEDATEVVEARQIVFSVVDEDLITSTQETADLFLEIGELPAAVDFAAVVDNVLK